MCFGVHFPLTGMCATCSLRGMVHLADYMIANNLSDSEVAEGINRSRPTVSRIRRKLVRPDWETIEKIKEYTNGVCSADDFQNLEAAQ